MSRPLVWIRNLAVILIIAAFAFFYGPSGSSPGIGVVAEVNGESVRLEIFEAFRSQDERRLRDQAPDMDAAELRDLLDARALDSVLRVVIIAQEAAALGLRVTDEELADEVMTSPQFQRDGRYDDALLDSSAQRLRLSTRDYLGQLRREIMRRKFERLVASPVRVSAAQMRAEIVRAGTTVRLRYAAARPGDFRDRIRDAGAAGAALLDQQPERVRTAYQRRRGEFQRPERIHVSHVLFSGPEADAEAAAALARLEAGEDFAALARELSDDEASGDQGGDLGSFPRGRMRPAFEEAAFSLAPGEVSAPVRTAQGVHLIRLEEREEAVQRSFEQVAGYLAAELAKDDLAARAAREVALAFLARLAEGRDFVEAADELGLIVRITPPLRSSARVVPGIGPVEGLVEAGFALTEERPHSRRLFATADAVYAVSLEDRQEPDPEQVEAELEGTRERFQDALRARTTEAWFRQRLQDLRRRGDLVTYPLTPPG